MVCCFFRDLSGCTAFVGWQALSGAYGVSWLDDGTVPCVSGAPLRLVGSMHVKRTLLLLAVCGKVTTSNPRRQAKVSRIGKSVFSVNLRSTFALQFPLKALKRIKQST